METKDLLRTVKRIKNKSNKDLLEIAKRGIENNYPPCCIIAFCEDLGRGESPVKRALDHSGFIPCAKHYEERKNKISTIPIPKISQNLKIELMVGAGIFVASMVFIYVMAVNKKARKKTIADMKRQKEKIASMTKKERELYGIILMEFHRSNIWEKITKKEESDSKKIKNNEQERTCRSGSSQSKISFEIYRKD